MKPSCRIVRWPRLLVVLISCTMLAVLSTAPTAAMPAHQAQTSGKVAINQVLWDHYPTVTLLVTVNNPGGGARGGLAEDAFTISEDGASIPSTRSSCRRSNRSGLRFRWLWQWMSAAA